MRSFQDKLFESIYYIARQKELEALHVPSIERLAGAISGTIYVQQCDSYSTVAQISYHFLSNSMNLRLWVQGKSFPSPQVMRDDATLWMMDYADHKMIEGFLTTLQRALNARL